MNYTELQNSLREFNTEIDLVYLLDKHDTFESFYDKMTDYISEQEIIYYYTAIEYLKNKDYSLKESLSIANELGYTVENLNSELLATLLYQQNLYKELQSINRDLYDLFNEYNN